MMWATRLKMRVIMGTSGLLHEDGYGSIVRRARGGGCRSPVTGSVRVVTVSTASTSTASTELPGAGRCEIPRLRSG